jgi:hypothetical protein
MKPPAYVSQILPGRIILEGDVRAVRDHPAITELRWSLFEWELPFCELPGSHLENDFLRRALLSLAEAGVCFLDDPRQGWSPADVMREIGVGRRFRTISWRGPGEWFTTEEAAELP